MSRIYELIKGQAAKSPEWDRHIHTVNRSVELLKDPGCDELSRREVDKLTEVTNRFRDVDDWALSSATHEFPEWSRNYREDTSSPIPWLDILSAQGKESVAEIIEFEDG